MRFKAMYRDGGGHFWLTTEGKEAKRAEARDKYTPGYFHEVLRLKAEKKAKAAKAAAGKAGGKPKGKFP